MRALYAGFAVLSLVAACGGRNNGDDDGDNGGDNGGDGGNGCVGLECQVVDCARQGMPTNTTLKGTVFAPNGTLPLFGVNVYVPRETPAALPDGAQCSRCSDELSGSPIVRIQTNDKGEFILEGVPAGDNIPLVITTGKWRRQITIPKVDACVETQLTAAQTSLPKNRAEGDIPKIAITTGSADTLECLVRKLGIADSEIGNATDPSRIHLYAGNGVSSFQAGFAGGQGSLASATQFWANSTNLKAYDVVILSCEGNQNAATKPQAALNAMKEYADIGGRVFASHWHNIWVSGHYQGTGNNQKPPIWDTIATWNNGSNFTAPIIDLIDEAANPKGPAFAQWMVNVMGSTTRGQIPVTEARTTAVTLDAAKAERWVYTQGGGSVPANRPQMFQFTTPNEVLPGDRCGKVVFTDMHVSGTPQNLNPYPSHCVGGNTLTPQEKALAFMFFDIASCVGPIF
jgi:hypothetical protein